MKIKTIRAVQLNLPRSQPKTPARRPSWNQSAPVCPPFPTAAPTIPLVNTSPSPSPNHPWPSSGWAPIPVFRWQRSARSPAWSCPRMAMSPRRTHRALGWRLQRNGLGRLGLRKKGIEPCCPLEFHPNILGAAQAWGKACNLLFQLFLYRTVR